MSELDIERVVWLTNYLLDRNFVIPVDDVTMFVGSCFIPGKDAPLLLIRNDKLEEMENNQG